MLSDRLIAQIETHAENPIRSIGRERELFRRVDYFFDGAIYYTALGYEQESSKPVAAHRVKAS